MFIESQLLNLVLIFAAQTSALRIFHRNPRILKKIKIDFHNTGIFAHFGALSICAWGVCHTVLVYTLLGEFKQKIPLGLGWQNKSGLGKMSTLKKNIDYTVLYISFFVCFP